MQKVILRSFLGKYINKSEDQFIENRFKIDGKKFMSEGSVSGIQIRFFPGSGQGKIMDPAPVGPERLDPVTIRPDRKPWFWVMKIKHYSVWKIHHPPGNPSSDGFRVLPVVRRPGTV